MGRSKTPVRAEMVTGTVAFMHCLAVTTPVSRASMLIDDSCIIVKERSEFPKMHKRTRDAMHRTGHGGASKITLYEGPHTAKILPSHVIVNLPVSH